MRFKHKILVITPVIFTLDQLTKWLVIKNIPLGNAVSVIPGYLDIVHLKNTGAAFGIFAGAPDGFRQWFFYLVAAVAVIFLAGFYSRMKDDARALPTAIALIFAGIAGNIIDRMRFGAVTDFISVHVRDVVLSGELFGYQLQVPLDWPAFNVADSAITVSMALLLITAFKKERRDQ